MANFIEPNHPRLTVAQNVCLAHDYLIQMGGAERVTASLLKAFPEAYLYTSCTEYNTLWKEFKRSNIINTFMQYLPSKSRFFKHYLLLYPLAFRLMRINPQCASLIVSCSTFSKFIFAPKRVKKILYCHNPPRFLYDEFYLRTEVPCRFHRSILSFLLPVLRCIDRKATRGYDVVVANSLNVRSRISAAYGIDSQVVHPPVNVQKFRITEKPGEYYLILSRLLYYKRIDIAVSAFKSLDRKLHIVGEGTDFDRLRQIATSNIHFFGKLDDEEIAAQYAGCKAFIFPGEEDFGITPLEAQSCGKPVIAFGRGGALETVVEGITGVFFEEQSPLSLTNAIYRCEQISWNPHVIRSYAEKFDETVFINTIRALVA